MSPKTSTLSPAELVGLARQGSREAYAALFDRYQNLVYAVCYSLTFRRETAEDLAQESFLPGFIHLKKLKQPEKFGVWLHGLARRRCIYWLRRKTKKTSVSLDAMPTEPLEAANPGRTQGLSAAMRREEVEQLNLALERLPYIYRVVVVLYHFDNKSYDEIANFLGVKRTLVDKRLLRARRMLRDMLQGRR